MEALGFPRPCGKRACQRAAQPRSTPATAAWRSCDVPPIVTIRHAPQEEHALPACLKKCRDTCLGRSDSTVTNVRMRSRYDYARAMGSQGNRYAGSSLLTADSAAQAPRLHPCDCPRRLSVGNACSPASPASRSSEIDRALLCRGPRCQAALGSEMRQVFSPAAASAFLAASHCLVRRGGGTGLKFLLDKGLRVGPPGVSACDTEHSPQTDSAELVPRRCSATRCGRSSPEQPNLKDTEASSSGFCPLSSCTNTRPDGR